MYRLLEFLRRTYVFILFLTLEGVATYVYANSNSYSNAKIVAYTSAVTSAIGEVTGGVGDYFRLRKENDHLLQRIAQLEEELAMQQRLAQDSTLQAMCYDDGRGIYYRATRVVSNTLNRRRNYLIINSGLADGVRSGMAVVTPNREMVGIVVECRDNHSVVMSILNTQFRSSGKLDVQSEHAGSIYWEGTDRYHINMKDLSKYAEIEEGTKIVTTGFSSIFPLGITIGYVSSYTLDIDGQSYSVEIDIAADMTALREVLVVSDMSNVEMVEMLESEILNPNSN
ncbi:MAG: rod shape-determining protein MreC [Rikenellaceae bacterium]